MKMKKKIDEKKDIKRIKENITELEYKKLMSFVRGNENFRENTKLNFLRTFTVLFFTGLRLNEVQELKIIDIKNLLQDGNVKIDISKTSTQRKLYLTNSFQKELLKLFDFKNEDNENRIITKGSDKNKRTSINNIVFIIHYDTHRVQMSIPIDTLHNIKKSDYDIVNVIKQIFDTAEIEKADREKYVEILNLLKL